MECYEGATMIKTFRGMMVDGAQDTILLHTNDGSTGYRIVKFQTIQEDPGTQTEHVVKIYKVKQTSVDDKIDFSNGTLLGVSYLNAGPSASSSTVSNEVIIFDKEIFNQDIYITSKTLTGSDEANYYIELEQIKLDLSESTVATLKDIRNIKRTATG
jgi:hypothetical protein